MNQVDFLQAQKILWAGMLEYGMVINPDPDNRYSVSTRAWRAWNQYYREFEGQETKNALPANFQAIIDWGKTAIPDYHTMSEFNDSNSPNTPVECLVGELILSDGQKFLIGCSNVTGVMEANKKMLDEASSARDEPSVDLVSKWNL